MSTSFDLGLRFLAIITSSFHESCCYLALCSYLRRVFSDNPPILFHRSRDVLRHQLLSISMLDSFLIAASWNLLLSEKPFQDISCRLCLKNEFKEISCLEIFDFWEKSDNDLVLKVLNIFGWDKADRVNFIQETWDFHQWVLQKYIQQPIDQFTYYKVLLLIIMVACTI